MATINNLYVQVVDEDWDKDVNSTSHPVEKGIEITDTIRQKPVVLSLSGNIVNVGTTKADTIVSKIEELKTKGSLITYVGRRTMSGLQIQAFKTSHPNTIWGGCKFEMELKEVRIANKAYTAPKTSTSTGSLKVGSKVIFKGGNVYVASDSKTAAAKRSCCTCTITQISTASWSIHKYHLIGGTSSNRVCGWVDESSIEGTVSSTSSTTNGGTQQVTSGGKETSTTVVSGSPVYHTVKKGDRVWTLAHRTYKELNTTEEFIIENNPNAFSRKNDVTSLIVGARLLVGYTDYKKVSYLTLT